jgi:hypothetical protein
VRSELLAQPREVALPPLEERGQLAQLHAPERGRELGRLEVPADLVEDEQVVVLDPVDVREEAPLALARAEQLRLAAPTPAPQREAAIDERVVVEQHHAARPGRGDDVREREARDADVRSQPGRRSAQPRTEAVA